MKGFRLLGKRLLGRKCNKKLKFIDACSHVYEFDIIHTGTLE